MESIIMPIANNLNSSSYRFKKDILIYERIIVVN